MRIATFNAENLFSRPVVMSYETNAQGQPFLDDFQRLNVLLKKPAYTEAVKDDIEALVDKYKLMDRRAKHDKLILREIRGKLWTQHNDGTRTWTAAGSGDFLGWVDLVRDTIDDQAMKNTARVIAEVNADIQVLVEIEDRVTLQRFHDDLLVPQLKSLNREPYPHVLLMDGNDPRGIDVALLSRVPVRSMKTNVELRNNNDNPLFPRDCAQFSCELAGGQQLIIFANHFSSKGSDKTGKRRKEQAEKVRELVEEALKSTSNVVVAGDMNEPPVDGHLSPLLNYSELKDAMAMQAYPEKTTFPGTYGTGAKSNKLDYLLLSKPLQSKTATVGVERRGYYSKKWKPFDTVTDKRTQASDHHCVWVDLNVQ
ncbi:MAG: endonuclease/exonuclease/phosphatase family protein [Candidatus Lindowbacteria bacterium]|nr:endonuclease/exonuclease/phosphatase family protein [Candidatus Lindowbacteria bacterium]